MCAGLELALATDEVRHSRRVGSRNCRLTATAKARSPGRLPARPDLASMVFARSELASKQLRPQSGSRPGSVPCCRFGRQPAASESASVRRPLAEAKRQSRRRVPAVARAARAYAPRRRCLLRVGDQQERAARAFAQQESSLPPRPDECFATAAQLRQGRRQLMLSRSRRVRAAHAFNESMRGGRRASRADSPGWEVSSVGPPRRRDARRAVAVVTGFSSRPLADREGTPCRLE